MHTSKGLAKNLWRAPLHVLYLQQYKYYYFYYYYSTRMHTTVPTTDFTSGEAETDDDVRLFDIGKTGRSKYSTKYYEVL